MSNAFFGVGSAGTRVKGIPRRPAAWRLIPALILCLLLVACSVTAPPPADTQDPQQSDTQQSSVPADTQQPSASDDAQDPQQPALPAVPLAQRVVATTLVPESGTVAFYAQSADDAEVLDTLQPCSETRLLVLDVQGDWAQLVYMGQLGWCRLEALQLSDTPLPLPDFLDDDQLVAYLQAFSVYRQLFGGSGLYDYNDTVTVQGQSVGGLPVELTACRALYWQGDYARAQQVLERLYVSPLQEQLQDRWRDVDGSLYEIAGDMGFVGEVLDVSFRQDEQTDSALAFTCVVQWGVADTYEDGQPVLSGPAEVDELPVSMVKGEDGVWRFSVIADPYTLRSSAPEDAA